MTVRSAIIDHRGLPDWPYRHLAGHQLHVALDRHHALRQHLGASLAPPRYSVTSLRRGLILAIEVSDEE